MIGALQAIEIICDTIPVPCDICSLKTLSKSEVLVGPAGPELSQAVASQVWVKVWDSCSKTLPDVLDFAQVTVFGSPHNQVKISAKRLVYMVDLGGLAWSG